MRGSKKGIAALLIILMAAAWACCLLGVLDGAEQAAEERSDYELNLSLAEDYMARGLYQKAIAAYTDVVAEKNLEADWAALLAAYQARYQEDTSILNSYIAAAKGAVAACDAIDFYKTLTALCLEAEDYTTAYSYLKQAVDVGVADQALLTLYQQVRYTFTLGTTVYAEVGPLCNGGYAVRYGESYGQLTATGGTLVKFQYDLIGGLGDDAVFVFTSGEEAGLKNTSGVLQGKLSFLPTAAGVYSEGLVPIAEDGVWSYYNLLGDLQFGAYRSAGSFKNGVAAVENEAGWMLVDASGDTVSPIYEEIRLNGDGSYLNCGVMLAKEQGQWRLYDENQDVIGDFSCDDIDVVTTDGMIAFQRNGLWGFVDSEGNVLVEPAYQQARSFSNGFAAVCLEGSWGFLTADGTMAFEAQWLDVGYFSAGGTCYVQTAESSWQLLTRRITE